jgi:hypothetical protein
LLRGNFCEKTLEELAVACVSDATDKSVDTALAPLALATLFRSLARSISGPASTATVDALKSRLDPLLVDLARSGIQNSDAFNHKVDDFLRNNRDLIR